MTRPVTAFIGSRRLAEGSLRDVARTVWQTVKDGSGQTDPVLIFDNDTGRVIDLEMRGNETDMLAHLDAMALMRREASVEVEADDAPTTAVPRGRGRPRLGVVAREVTLLPRHWDWLASQPGGASVALRRLVDAARHSHTAADRWPAARDAAYTFVSAMAGDLPHYEEAIRALYRNDEARFRAMVDLWPPDIREYAIRLAFPLHERAEGAT